MNDLTDIHTFEKGSKLKISPSFSTISKVPTNLKYFLPFPVSESGAFKIIPNNFPMGVIVFVGSRPRNRGNALRGNCFLLGMVLLGQLS